MVNVTAAGRSTFTEIYGKSGSRCFVQDGWSVLNEAWGPKEAAVGIYWNDRLLLINGSKDPLNPILLIRSINRKKMIFKILIKKFLDQFTRSQYGLLLKIF